MVHAYFSNSTSSSCYIAIAIASAILVLFFFEMVTNVASAIAFTSHVAYNNFLKKYKRRSVEKTLIT